MLTLEEVLINILETAKEPIYEKIIFVKLLDNDIWNYGYTGLKHKIHDILIDLINKKLVTKVVDVGGDSFILNKQSKN